MAKNGLNLEENAQIPIPTVCIDITNIYIDRDIFRDVYTPDPTSD